MQKVLTKDIPKKCPNCGKKLSRYVWGEHMGDLACRNDLNHNGCGYIHCLHKSLDNDKINN